VKGEFLVIRKELLAAADMFEVLGDPRSLGLVARIALLWAQIPVEDIGGEGHPLEAGQPP